MISNLSFIQFFLLFVSMIIKIISQSTVAAFVVMFCMLLASLHFLLVALT